MLTIKDYENYTSDSSSYKDVKKIFSYSWEDHLKFFNDNRKILNKTNKGLCGKFSEKVFKDCFVLTHETPYQFNGSLKKEIKTFLHNSPSSTPDILFETMEEVGVSKVRTIHTGSGKNTTLSEKKVLSIADSDINNEYQRCRSVMADYARKEMWLVISAVVNVFDLDHCYKDDIDCCHIVLFDDKIINSYINEAPRGLPNGFKDKVKELLDEGWLSLHSMKAMFYEAQQILRKYEDNYHKYFRSLYGEKPFSLYFVQERLIEEALKKFSSGCNEVCITATVRSGKTPMSAIISKEVENDFRGKVVVFESFFPETFPKIVSDFRRALGEENINVIDISDGVVVVNPNKLNLIKVSGQYTICGEIKPLARQIISIADMLIFDEAHIGFGSAKQHSLRMYMKSDAKILALTATPGFSVKSFAQVRFTELDVVQSVLDGHQHYKNIPIRVRITNDVFDNKAYDSVVTREFDSASKLVSNENDIIQYFKFIMNHCDNGIFMDKVIESGKAVFNNVNFGVNFVRKYNPHNMIVFCNNWKELKKVYESLISLSKLEGKKRLEVHWTTSMGNSKGSSKNAVDFVNEIFHTCDNTYRFVLVVGQCGVGATINNLEAVVMLNNTEEYSVYEQKSGRCCQPVCKNGRWLNYTFVFDPCASRSVSKIDNAKIKYLTQKSYYTNSSKESAWVRSTTLCMDATNIHMIEPKMLSEYVINSELINEVRMGISGVGRIEWYKNALGVINDFDIFDNRFDYERLLNIIGYNDKNAKVKVTVNNDNKRIIEYTFYKTNKEGEVEEHKVEVNPMVILSNLWRAFLIRMTMFSIGHTNRIHKVLDKKTSEEFFNALNDLMIMESNENPCWKQYFNDTIFNPNYCQSFDDIISIFYNEEDETKRFIGLNTIRETIEKIMETVLSHNRGDVLRMLMTNNAVAEFGEVFTPIKFINEVIIPAIVERYGKNFFAKKDLKIADIACGSGNFLIALYNHVFEAQRKYFNSDEECDKHLIENVFYGNDIQECHVVTTKHTLDRNNLVPNNSHITCCDTLSDEFDFWGGTHFDLIIGNPPYQKQNSKKTKGFQPQIYPNFVKLAVNHADVVIQIIKAVWIMEEKNSFRKYMMNPHLAELHNYTDSRMIFPSFKYINGGCCWFIWDNNYEGKTNYHFINTKDEYSYSFDTLKGTNIFRNKHDYNISKKVMEKHSLFFDEIVSAYDFFKTRDGKTCRHFVTDDKVNDNDVMCYTSKGYKYLPCDMIRKNLDFVDIKKICVSASGVSVSGKCDNVFTKPIILHEGSICSESYNILKVNLSEEELNNCLDYIKLRPVRQLIKQNVRSQNIGRESWKFVPWQDFKTPWTEERFYETYGYTKEEIAYVNSEVKTYTTD